MTPNRESAHGLLKGGMIVSIVLHTLYSALFPIILLIILTLVGAFTGIIDAIVQGFGGEPTGEVDLSFLVPYFVAMVVSLFYSFVSFGLSVACLIMINHAKTEKGLRVCGILAIVASVPFIIVPFLF